MPTFKPFLVGNTIDFSFKTDLCFLQDLTQPGMWGMGNVYNGIDDVIDRGKHISFWFFMVIEYGIFGEGSQISTNQNRENSAFSLLIGRNVKPFPENTVLYCFKFCFDDRIID